MRPKSPLLEDGSKRKCVVCGEIKSLEEFYSKAYADRLPKPKASWYMTECKICFKKRMKDHHWYIKSKEIEKVGHSPS